MDIRLLNIASNGSEYFWFEKEGSVALILEGDWNLGNELMVLVEMSTGGGLAFCDSIFLE
jgi:hypothetical protein